VANGSPSRLIPGAIGTRALLALVLAAAVFGLATVPNSRGDLSTQITAGQSAARALRSQIAAETAKIERTAGGIAAARAQLASIEADLVARIAQLRAVQDQLLAARARLVELENRLRTAAAALAVNLRASYEGAQPNLMTVILESRGFASLLEQVDFLQRIGRQDAMIVTATRAARLAVFHEAIRLGTLEERDRSLTEEILARRNQIAAIEATLLQQQIAEVAARSGTRARLAAVQAHVASLRARLAALQARALEQARQSALEVNQMVGGIAIDPAGMAQAPPGAPQAVREIIAAGNAIATLPYIWGGGHGSFQAAGYDCSGSVSYVLAAAGLLSAPMVSGDFESYGAPGPGQWVTIYANAGHVWMDVAGWRFDTVALAEGGTRWSRGGGEFGGFVVRHPVGL
jgi:hypothetical protein